MRVRCKIIRKVFANNSGTFHIFGCEPLDASNSGIVLNKYGNFTIKGSLGMLEVGREYTLEIKPYEEDKYGISYKVVRIPSFDDFKIADLDDIDDDKEYQMLKLIMSKEQADNVHEAYPNFIRLILSGNDKDISYKDIYNVGKVRFKAYVAKVNNLFKYYKLVSDNEDIELTYDEAGDLCSIYGSMTKVQKKIDQSPYYILCCILHRSIPQTDRLLLSVRPDLKASTDRCEIIMWYLLQQNEADGNTRISGVEFYKYVAQWDTALVPVMLDVIESPTNTLIQYDSVTKMIAINSTYLAEKKIADDIYDRLTHSVVWNCDTEQFKKVDNFEITTEQSEILELLCTKNACMLIGYSGAGKTSSVKAIIAMLESLHKSYRLLSPTGIAAKRLKEATGRNASTIHRTIMGENVHLSDDVVIIDEASMVGVGLLAKLLDAVDRHSKILLIFDAAQLASISCGNVVHDLMKCGKIPTAQLTKVFRYGTSGISTIATDIRNGTQYLSNEGDVICENAANLVDYTYLNATSKPINCVLDEYDRLTDKYGVDEVLVVSPFNVGALGTYAINKRIQEEYNPNVGSDNYMVRKLPDAPKGIITFYEGDKVINKQNNYHAKTVEYLSWKEKHKRLEHNLEQTKELDGEDSDGYYSLYDNLMTLEENAPDEAHIMNGDIGYIRRIEGNVMYIQFDEEIIIFEQSDLQNLLLAYCCSAHSVQGCEIEAVILITCKAHQRILTRNLCYMAATRAKEQLVQIGDSVDVINHALSINETNERDTWLYDLLEAKEWAKN